jgi:hypothetical protein
VTDLYGNTNDPVIYGLDTCERFRRTTPPDDASIGTAGLFNTGTNPLSMYLQANCEIPTNTHDKFKGMRWQVPVRISFIQSISQSVIRSLVMHPWRECESRQTSSLHFFSLFSNPECERQTLSLPFFAYYSNSHQFLFRIMLHLCITLSKISISLLVGETHVGFP